MLCETRPIRTTLLMTEKTERNRFFKKRKGVYLMRKLYEAPMMEEWQLQADEAINAIPESANNDGEFENWT